MVLILFAAAASANCTFKPGFDVVGHNLGVVGRIPSPEACCAACARMDGCVAGVWKRDTQGNECAFKSDATPEPSGADLTLTIPGDSAVPVRPHARVPGSLVRAAPPLVHGAIVHR